MLDPRLLRESPEVVRQALADRNMSYDLDHLLNLEEGRRNVLQKVEALRAERNRLSSEVPKAKKEGRDATELIEEGRRVGDQIKTLDTLLREHEEEFLSRVSEIPNIPSESTPRGSSEDDNVEIRVVGEPTAFPFEAKGHWDIGTDLGIVDFEVGAKISGARFTLMKGLGARLERSLINLMLDIHTGEHGYTEAFPPIAVNEASLYATGQLPKLRDDMYACTDDLFLIPTAEVPITNIHRDEIIEGDRLPIYYAAYTPCFRREAGSYGRETRGLIRQHQFNKVEMVRFVHPDTSFEELESLVGNAEVILQRLGLPYRVVELCTADLSFAAAKCYDLEVWMPGMGKYVEISSCSNFVDFQTRRGNIRFRDEEGKIRQPHTLNGSGLAIGRTVAAILENYQREDGSVEIPDALRSYMGDRSEIRG